MRFVQLVATVSALLSSAKAVYIDEAFNVDWHHESVGSLVPGQTAVLPNGVLGALTSANVLAALNTSDGSVLWRHRLDRSSSAFAQVGATKFCVSLSEAPNSRIEVYNAGTGYLDHDVLVKDQISVLGSAANGFVAVGSSVHFVSEGKKWETPLGEQWTPLRVVDINDNEFAISAAKDTATFLIKYSKQDGSASKPVRIANGVPGYVIGSDRSLALALPEEIAIVNVDFKGNIEATDDFKTTDVPVVVEFDKEGVIVGDQTATQQAPPAQIGGAEVDINGASVVLKAGGSIIVQYSNGVLSSFVPGPEGTTTAWTREEDLVNAVSGLFIDLPETTSSLSEEELLFEEKADIASAYLRRIKRHLEDIKYLPDYLVNKLRIVKDEPVYGSTDGDLFGFRKFFVVATKAGRLIAFDTLNKGKVAWKVQLPTTKDEVVKAVIRGQSILVFTRSGEAVEVDGFVGATVSQTSLGLTNSETIAQVLEYHNGTDVSLAAWTTDNRLIPIQKPLPQAYFTSASGSIVSGFDAGSATWSFSLPDGYRVTAAAKRDPLEITASIGTILGDRSVLYKYLNPNTVAIAAINDNGDLAVYLLDAVTGRVLHEATHKGEKIDLNVGVQIVYGEHWVVYTYTSLNGGNFGPKLVVWDLYESDKPNERWSDKLPLEEDTYIYSSFDSYPLPHVKSQSFVLPGDVTALGITRTKFGVTSRDIVAALANGKVLSLPKRLVDARRPVNRDPTKDEMEEGLVKYDAMLVNSPQAVISHQRTVYGDQFAVAAASLESTSLIAGFGFDVFFTRVTPSLPFDILNSNFGKTKLVYTIVALLVIVNVLRPMVSRRAVNQKWGI
ncbi:ER membrane protein complex subunit 1 [Trichomonascus vanleenenianus]|uniref:Emc1p n=1 Tax=Trichomonascus vanleenenianus TaxID=2268995 RepID=UPI003ECA5683